MVSKNCMGMYYVFDFVYTILKIKIQESEIGDAKTFNGKKVQQNKKVKLEMPKF